MIIQSGGMGPEQSYTQSFMSSTQIGPDGKPIEERYYSKKLDAVGPDGKRVSMISHIGMITLKYAIDNVKNINLTL